MIVKVKGIVTKMRSSSSGIVYITAFTPSGRLSCYASELKKKPFLEPDKIKYAEVELKLYSRSRSYEGLVRFPCEIIELRKVSVFTEDEMKRNIFRYICYLSNNFSVVKSGEKFYDVLKAFHDFLKSPDIDLRTPDVRRYLMCAELFILAAEGLIGKPDLCLHVDQDFKKSVFYVVNKNTFECFSCVTEDLKKEVLYMKSLNRKPAKYFYKLLDLTRKGIGNGSILKAMELLEKDINHIVFPDILSLWDICFTYHFFTYVHEKRGGSFFRMREKFYRISSDFILKEVSASTLR